MSRRNTARRAVLAILALSPAAGWAETAPALDVAALSARAEAGDATAAFQLGNLYWSGIGATQDYLKARNLLQKAADQGLGDAQCELGLLYQTATYADTPPQDFDAAMKWYAKAAEQDNGCGQFGLAMLREDGLGGPKDPGQASALFAKAAAHGYARDPDSFPLQQLFGHFRAISRALAP